VAALAGHLEGNIVGGVALDLNGTGIEVVEVLVKELEKRRRGELRRNGEKCLARKAWEVAWLCRGAYVVGRLGDIGESGDRHGERSGIC
jgi:hypothetical protein